MTDRPRLDRAEAEECLARALAACLLAEMRAERPAAVARPERPGRARETRRERSSRPAARALVADGGGR